MEFLSQYGASDLFWIELSLFLTGMSKGGFPVGAIALPVLILVWPGQAQAARAAVGFMLPMLCLMDVVALAFYWHKVQWGRLIYLMPATVAGVALASFLFVSDESALIAVSDRALKIMIGALGILFVVYFAAKKWILRHIHASEPTWTKGSVFGFAAGITSTLAHAAGPVMQMYLLPQQLEKKKFAGTSCAFFWMLNLVKLLPFAMLGRIQPEGLKLGAVLLPVIPLGVAFGWWLTHKTEQKHYTILIYAVLLITSIALIVKAF
ncbi:MAG: sulfite exporter TauE/SafE family protein [Kiritimatiellales bacterium]|nr:sulfite exporter TauE/SafE family protein [Kiritimatiellales bacterium]MCF7864702.1 sulfite exporter TauE/SafE family protein [Kiritimatiellales bacterium]